MSDETSTRDRVDLSARQVVGYCMASLSVACAVIHFSVAGEHFREYWLFGVFMLVIAWAQLLWAIVAVARPSRVALGVGAGLNVGVVAVYLVTRTVGDLVGPSPREIEPVGFTDALCTAFEVLVILGCAWLLAGTREHRVRRRLVAVTVATTAGLVAALVSASLVAAGPEMSDAMASESTADPTNPSPMDMANTPHLRVPTASPAGAITFPDSAMLMKGMKMADSTPCETPPTPEQQAAAVDLVNASWRDARNFQSLAAAQAAGYRPVTPSGRKVVHYINPTYYLAVRNGGPALNTEQPASLVYANTSHGAVLAAAMYIAAPNTATPQPGGCLTQWHVHTNLCMSAGRAVVAATSPADPACPQGSRNRATPPMMHIWFVPVPGGPTAIDAPAGQVVSAAQHVSAPANGPA
ncbi:MAG: hypothetical protein J2P20_20135 [Pseudonocardia sp.]|nr:hypothetical protein [Pseudonocardia sp.]MBO0872948.1 hypothetical protein [Pseudonocardia sp.]